MGHAGDDAGRTEPRARAIHRRGRRAASCRSPWCSARPNTSLASQGHHQLTAGGTPTVPTAAQREAEHKRRPPSEPHPRHVRRVQGEICQRVGGVAGVTQVGPPACSCRPAQPDPSRPCDREVADRSSSPSARAADRVARYAGGRASGFSPAGRGGAGRSRLQRLLGRNKTVPLLPTSEPSATHDPVLHVPAQRETTAAQSAVDGRQCCDRATCSARQGELGVAGWTLREHAARGDQARCRPIRCQVVPRNRGTARHGRDSASSVDVLGEPDAP